MRRKKKGYDTKGVCDGKSTVKIKSMVVAITLQYLYNNRREQEGAGGMDAEEGLKKRWEELAVKCCRNQCYTYTGFLGMAELALFHRMKQRLSGTDHTLFGGRPESERQMIQFGSREMLGYEEAFPIACVEVAPSAPKYAEELTHRDFLGGILSLGIERATLGDIMVDGKKGYVFCTSFIAPFLVDTLVQVKHTSVKCRIGSIPERLTEQEWERIHIQAASERIDGVLAKVCKLSRGDSLELFRRKKIFLNGGEWENNSYLLKPGDVISVRGFGRFTFIGCEGFSKKGKKHMIIDRPR